MFDALTFDDLLQEERARIREDVDVLARIERDIAHGLAPELAIASHVKDPEKARRLQQQLATAAARRQAGPKDRLIAYPHDPFR
jgi:hypothetical protein